MWRLEEVIDAVKGTLYRAERDRFDDISTDSRTIREGELFIPVTGPHYDGHQFIDDAYGKSHAGALCERKRHDIYDRARGTVILVDDTTRALLDLARYKRNKLHTTCLAITGSNGKTTTKEILVHMMTGYASVHYNEKNYNNLIGVSKSILAIDGNPDFCIFELGTNARGEIRQLAEAISPDASLITNINPSHLEGLKTLEGILEEKLDLFRFTKEGGTIFINADDPYIMPHYKDVTNRVPLTYSMMGDASFHLNIDENMGWEGTRITITLRDDLLVTKTSLLGRHNLYNILAASSLAYSVGVDKGRIGKAIESFTSFDKRLRPVVTKRGFIIIDDTYNANPASMEWAIRTLIELPSAGQRIVVIGDMRELGEKSKEYHRELGRFLKSTDVPVILLIGQEVQETYYEIGKERARFFEDKEALISYINERVKKGDTLLVKGSRASKMEEIVEALA